MNNKLGFLAIIPARGGSKRLPGKNVAPIAGKPMIAWTIDAAIKSNLLTEVMVTTDDEKIAELAKQMSVNVPFIRPDYLATDTASTFDVVKHVIEYCQDELDHKFDFIVLLQPTSPLRTGEDIDTAIRLLIEKSADAVVSVCKTEHSPLWSNTLTSNGSMDNFIQDSIQNKRSQDLDDYYRLNGAIYIVNTRKLLEQRSFILQKNTYAYVMDRENSIDIDEQLDFKIAECLLNFRKQ